MITHSALDTDLEMIRGHMTTQVRTYYQSAWPAVLIPAYQAMITGLFAGLLALLLAWLLDAARPYGWGLGAGIGFTLLFWYTGLKRWENLIWTIESAAAPLPIEPEPAPAARETIRVEVTQGNQTQIAELPISRDKLGLLAAGLLEGRPLSEAEWTGANGLFSLREFRELRDVLLSRGWIAWVNPDYPRQGLTITRPGNAALKAALPHPSDDPPVNAAPVRAYAQRTHAITNPMERFTGDKIISRAARLEREKQLNTNRPVVSRPEEEGFW